MNLKFWKKKKKDRERGEMRQVVRAENHQAIVANNNNLSTIDASTRAQIFAQRGDESMRDRHYDTAILMYGAALEFSPNDPDLYRKRAAVFTCLNPARNDLALRDLQRSAALNWSSISAATIQTEILTRNGLAVSSAAGGGGSGILEAAQRAKRQIPLPQPPTAEELRVTRLRTVSPPDDVVAATINVREVSSPPRRPAQSASSRTVSHPSGVVPRTINVSREAEISSSPSQRPAQPKLPLRSVEQHNVINQKDEAPPSSSSGDSSVNNGEAPLTRPLQHETCGESSSRAPITSRLATVTDDSSSHPSTCNLAEENRDTVEEVPEDEEFTVPQSMIDRLVRARINVSAASFLTHPEPLFYASAYGQLDILQFIFAHLQQEHPHLKNNKNTTSWHGYPTPLNAALENRRHEAANLMMSHGAVFTERSTGRKEQIADLVSFAGDNVELLDRLICLKNTMTKSVSVEDPFGTNNGAWALFFSFQRNNLRFVRYLWENGVREYVKTREATSVDTSLGHIYVLYHSNTGRCREINNYLRSSSRGGGGVNEDLEQMWWRSHRLPRSQRTFPLPLPPEGTSARCPAGPRREANPFIEMEILRWE